MLNAGPAYVDVSVPAEKYSTVFVEDCMEGGGVQGKDHSRGAKGHLLTGRQVGRRDARYAVGIIRGRIPLIDSESEAERLRIRALGRGIDHFLRL